MRWVAAVLVVGWGCAAPAAVGPRAEKAPEIAAAPDRTGLTFLLPSQAFATETSRAADEALRKAMSAAGYKVVSDVAARHDAELVTRVAISSGSIGVPGSGSHRDVETSEQVHFTLSAIDGGRLIDIVHSDFSVRNAEVTPSHVAPAIDALARSPKLAAYSAKVKAR